MSIEMGGPIVIPESFDARYLSTSSATVTGTAEQSLISAGVGSATIPSTWIVPGATARLIIRGVMSTPTIAGTTTFRFKTNGTTRATGVTASLFGGATNVGFVAYETISFRTLGTSGTAVCAGDVRYPGASLTQRSVVDVIAATPFTIDTTSDLMLDFTAQWSLTSHTMTTVTTTLELLAPGL